MNKQITNAEADTQELVYLEWASVSFTVCWNTEQQQQMHLFHV